MEHFAWPIAVVLIVVIFIAVFYKTIRQKLGGIATIDGKKVQFEQSLVQQKTENKSLIEELEREVDIKLLKEAEELVRKNLKINEHNKPQETIDLLVKYISVQGLVQRFEDVYRSIFGSQLDLLKHINASYATKKDLKIYYDTAVTAFPALGDYSYDEYFDFLTGNNLITRADDNSYGITIFGREFLTYLIKKAYSFSKPY